MRRVGARERPTSSCSPFRASGTGDLAEEPPFLLATLFRKALEEGKLRKTGEVDVRGHRAILVEAADPHGDVLMRAALDAESFRPLRMRYFKGGTCKDRSTCFASKRSAVSRRSSRLPSPAGSSPGTITSGGSSDLGPISIQKARAVFGVTPLWAGPAVDGHALDAVVVENVTDTGRGRTVNGRLLRLDYGVAREHAAAGAYLQIEQAPEDSRLWQPEWVFPPPAGYVDVTTSRSGSGRGAMHTDWTGVMREGGFYLRLTSRSRETLIAAARALAPVP